MSRQNLETESALIWGGTSGIGFKIVAEELRAGAKRVFVGTRNLEHFATTVKLLERREKIADTSPLHPVVADVTDKKQIDEAVRVAKAEGFNGGRTYFCQAGGMQDVFDRLFTNHLDEISTDYTFSTPIEELPLEKLVSLEERLQLMQIDLAIWTEQVLPSAIAVNYQGTFDAIEVMGDNFPDGFSGVFTNSTWGHFSGRPGIEIPLLYRPIDLSKAMVRDRLQVDASTLQNADIYIAEEVISLVSDTKVGKIFKDFLFNLMDPEQREAVRSSSILSLAAAKAARLILTTSPVSWPNPAVFFVYGREGQGVMSTQMELSPMYTKPYRF